MTKRWLCCSEAKGYHILHDVIILTNEMDKLSGKLSIVKLFSKKGSDVCLKKLNSSFVNICVATSCSWPHTALQVLFFRLDHPFEEPSSHF